MSIEERADLGVDHLNRLNYFYHIIFDQNINMDDFDDRLKLQKLVYILNSQNIRFNYNFTWYIHGPYSSELTRDGYAYTRRMNGFRQDYHPSGEERNVVDRIRNARALLVDPVRAELVASFLYLTDRYGSQDSAREQLMIRKPRFTQDHIQQVMHEWFDRIQTN